MTTRINREVESRAHEMRDTYATDYISRLSIPLGVAKEGYSYHWGRKDVKGQDDFRIEELVAKGWTPVPAERATNQYFGDPLERNPLSKKFICCKDLILMERPEVYSTQERQRFNDYNNNRLKSLRGVSNDLGTFGRTNTVINSF
jgi:hypothetical protein